MKEALCPIHKILKIHTEYGVTSEETQVKMNYYRRVVWVLLLSQVRRLRSGDHRSRVNVMMKIVIDIVNSIITIQTIITLVPFSQNHRDLKSLCDKTLEF